VSERELRKKVGWNRGRADAVGLSSVFLVQIFAE